MSKYYIAKLVGLKNDFVYNKSVSDSLEKAIFNAPKKEYGMFIFEKTIGGYKEVITGKRFKCLDYSSENKAPKDTGIMIDKRTAVGIPSSVSQEKIDEYKNKHNKEQLLDYFEKIQNECDELLPLNENNKIYYVASLVGITEDFKHTPGNKVSYSIYQAPKRNYGDFIFSETEGGYREVITGMFFKFINDGWSDGPFYEAPNSSGLMVDRRTAVEIPRFKLKKKLAAYNKEHEQEQLTRFLVDTLDECNDILINEITKDKQIKKGPRI